MENDVFPPFFGPVSHRLTAGDLAPDLTSAKLLRSPGGAAWTSANFEGHFTLLSFCPNTTANSRPVAQWNAMVRQFAAQSVHFLWFTAEDEAALVPWLAQNPVDGWMLHDSSGRAARSFGLETPQSVIVGPDGRILGYDHLPVFRSEPSRAALEEQSHHHTAEVREGRQWWGLSQLAECLSRRNLRPCLGQATTNPRFPPSHTLHVSPSRRIGWQQLFGTRFPQLAWIQRDYIHRRRNVRDQSGCGWISLLVSMMTGVTTLQWFYPSRCGPRK